jgi:hypothetical protein
MNPLLLAIPCFCFSFFAACNLFSQPPQDATSKPKLVARVEIVHHEHCFTVKYFIKNEDDEDVELVYGRGDSGIQIVPTLQLGAPRYLTITPPTYLAPGRRTMQANLKKVEAGKEILYGTFTMGYPPSSRDQEVDLAASIEFRDQKSIERTPAVRLKIPAQSARE